MTDSRPPAPVPDDKDWTWVLDRPCPECGFDAAAIAPDRVGALVRDNAAAWVELLGGDAAIVRARPEPQRWSPLEYACHVRDVFGLFAVRLDLMLAEDGPTFANWDQDVTAVESRYDLADPGVVARELAAAGEAIATRFDALADDEWNRTGHRSDGATFTVASFARYFIHDPIHHLSEQPGG